MNFEQVWGFGHVSKQRLKLKPENIWRGTTELWAKVLHWNQVVGSSLMDHFPCLRDWISLRGSWQPLTSKWVKHSDWHWVTGSGSSTVVQSWPWVNQVADKKKKNLFSNPSFIIPLNERPVFRWTCNLEQNSRCFKEKRKCEYYQT